MAVIMPLHVCRSHAQLAHLNSSKNGSSGSGVAGASATAAAAAAARGARRRLLPALKVFRAGAAAVVKAVMIGELEREEALQEPWSRPETAGSAGLRRNLSCR